MTTTEDYILELRRTGLRRGEMHTNLMLEAAERMAEQVAETNKLKDKLQSQAERIAELDSLAANAIVAAADSQKACMKLLDEDLALRAELADMAVNTATYRHLVDLANDTATRLLKERDTLRAELAAIAALDVTELVGALQLFAYALPLDKSTVKTCYAVNNQMRDAAHAALSKYKGAK